MPDDVKFTEKDYDRIIDDIMDEFFEQHDLNYDLKELMKVQMFGGEMPQIEGGKNDLGETGRGAIR